MTVPFPFQNVMHEFHVIAVGQWDLSITQLGLERAVEEAQKQVIGQRGGAPRCFRLLCKL